MKHSVNRLLGVVATAALGMALTTAAVAQETIKIGLLLTYSGMSATSGVISDNTIKLFQQKYGTTVAGKKIELVKRDTTGPNPEVVKRLAQELIVREKVQIMIGPDFTPNVMAAAPLVTEGKVPTFQTGAATTGLVGERSPYYLRTYYTIAQVTRPMAQWAWKNGVRKPYLLIADYGPGQDTEAVFTKSFTELGGSIAGVSRVTLRSPEFSSYMQRIKDTQPDTVFVFLPAGELVAQFLKAYADSGLKNTSIKLMGFEGVTDETVMDAAGDAAIGVITSGIYANSHDSALNRQYLADYYAQFGKTLRPSSSNIAVWDAMRIIYDGIAAQGSAPFDPDKFMAFAKGRTLESPRGPITIDKANGDIRQTVYIRKVEKRDGVLHNVEFDSIKEVDPR